tara:strand:- start:47 stop:469 length:423 start_codon:yes stop_codon:yes gene_type:complete
MSIQKKIILKPIIYENHCRVAFEQIDCCSLPKKKFRNGRNFEMVSIKKGIIRDAKSGRRGSSEDNGKMDGLVHSVIKALEVYDEIKLRTIGIIFLDIELAREFIRREVNNHLDQVIKRYPRLELQVWHFDPTTSNKPEKL